AAALALLGMAGLAAGFVATARVTGLPHDYIVRWWWVISAWMWLSIVVSAAALVSRRWQVRVAVGAGVVAAVASVALTVGAVTADPPAPAESEAIIALVDQLDGVLPTDRQYVVEWADRNTWGEVGVGVFVGVNVGVDVAVGVFVACSVGVLLGV
ncbi:MAG TPA: hypothetical protein PLV68_15350, partial [Ilumatobacteraceae bacterium]|nr:hypothetical protein [Ilumatobacteraceae bacterium]